MPPFRLRVFAPAPFRPRSNLVAPPGISIATPKAAGSGNEKNAAGAPQGSSIKPLHGIEQGHNSKDPKLPSLDASNDEKLKVLCEILIKAFLLEL